MFGSSSGDEKEVEDDVDSDFSIEEKDEPVSDHEDEGPKRQKKVVTKAYKVLYLSFKWNYYDFFFILEDLLNFMYFLPPQEPKPAPPPGTVEKKPKEPKKRKPKMTADMYGKNWSQI